MSIPVEDTTFSFTPKLLEGIENPPVITFKYATRREKSRMQDTFLREGLEGTHSKEELRDAIISEIRLGWESDQIEDIIDSVRRFWFADDEFVEQHKEWSKDVLSLPEDTKEEDYPEKPEFEFDKSERSKVENLLDDVKRHSKRIKNIIADNAKWHKESPRVISRVVIQSAEMLIKGIPIDHKFVRKDNIITDDSLYDFEEAIEKLCKENGIYDKRETVIREIYREGSKALDVSKEEQKNSSSQQPTTTDQSGSMEQEEKSSKSQVVADSNPSK